MITIDFDLLKEIMKYKGYTYDRLSEQTQMSRSSIVNIVNGHANPTLFSIRRIAQVLELSNQDIIDIFINVEEKVKPALT